GRVAATADTRNTAAWRARSGMQHGSWGTTLACDGGRAAARGDAVHEWPRCDDRGYAEYSGVARQERHAAWVMGHHPRLRRRESGRAGRRRPRMAALRRPRIRGIQRRGAPGAACSMGHGAPPSPATAGERPRGETPSTNGRVATTADTRNTAAWRARSGMQHGSWGTTLACDGGR